MLERQPFHDFDGASQGSPPKYKYKASGIIFFKTPSFSGSRPDWERNLTVMLSSLL